MHSPGRTGATSASALRSTASVAVPGVQRTMAAASVVPPNTVPPVAPVPCAPLEEEDPHRVVTPVNTDAVEELLAKLSLSNNWEHIVCSLREGLDTDVNMLVYETLVFENHLS